MGSLEESVKNKSTRIKMQNVLLLAIYTGAALTLAFTAPNAVKLLKGIDPDFAKKRKPAYRMQQALSRLKDRGLLRTEEGGKLALTKKGEMHAKALADAKAITIKKPHRWDGKWRVVIFDVWERRRSVRNALRSILKRAGFVRVQGSVWAHPYDCEELIAFVKTDLRLGKGILYIIAEGIENDTWLRKTFGL